VSIVLLCLPCLVCCAAVCCWCQQYHLVPLFAHLSGQSAMLSCPSWHACRSLQVAGLAGEGQRRRGDLHNGIEQGLFKTCAKLIHH
jgi:hypothetical protein